MGLIKRLPSLSPAEFGEHWRGPHGTFGSRIPNLRRYHQNHVVRSFTVAGLPDRWQLDGLSELWFDSLDIMTRSIASPAYAALASDTPTVMTMPGLVAGTQEMIAGSDQQTSHLRKLMMVVGRRRERAPDTFLRDWRAALTAAGKAVNAAGIRNTVVSHREIAPLQLAEYDALPVDVVAELWLEDDTTIDKFVELASFQRSIRELSENVSAYAVQTYVIVA